MHHRDERQRKLFGRTRELVILKALTRAAAGGTGTVVLISGEAGIGKTALIDTALAKSKLLLVRAAASPRANAPFGPIATLLRSLRSVSLTRDVAHVTKLLLAEGNAERAGNRAELIEELGNALAAVSQTQPLGLVLDDLQWADHATLELLPVLAARFRTASVLVIAIYRNDEVLRGHPLRAVREDLRRARLLKEIVLGPLDSTDTARFIESLLGFKPPLPLVTSVSERGGYVPLFVESLISALKSRHDFNPDSLGAVPLPLPANVRDAILARVDLLSTAGRQVAEAAAVVGGNLPLELISRVNGGDTGIEELIGSGLLIERGSGLASFQSPVAGEAIYAAIPWTRRRWLHRRAAEALEAVEQDASQMAEHWRAAGESDRARQSLLEGAARSRRLHSHRDAVHLLRRAIDMWTIGHEEADRLAALDQLGDCAQLSGQTTDALRAWRELIDSSSRVTNSDAAARALRKIANLHEVNCDWARALDARQDAMAAFGVGGNYAEAAVEGINAAIRLRMSSRYSAALEVLSRASEYVETTERADLKVRIAALKGNLEARLGRVEEGSAAIREALDAALALNDPALAGEVYQRLADAIERSGRYRNAVSVGLEGVRFCDDHRQPGGTLACLTCMGFILVRSGEWHEAVDTSQRILNSPGCSTPARTGALAFLGLIHVMRGQLRKGEELLLESEVLARRVDHAVGEIHSRWGLAIHDDLCGENLLAAERCRGILARYQTVDEGHALIPVFRWASTCFANAGDKEGLHACCEVLGEIAASFSSPEGLSALAHAFGEMAWLEGDAARACEHFERSIELIEDWDLPRERVESQLRAATACAAVGRLEAAVELARDAYRNADRLGAQPLVKAAEQQLRTLGEPLSGARGPRGVRRTIEGGLTARQRQVLTAVSQGMTDKEIARKLKLSPRTVEMHVAHALAALDCRNRAEAVRRASELGVLQTG